MVNSIKLLLSITLTITHKLCYIVVLFSSVYFLMSCKALYLTHALFRNVLFIFRVFPHFPVLFLVLVSSCIFIMARGYALYNLKCVKFVEVCLMTEDNVYFGEFSMDP